MPCRDMSLTAPRSVRSRPALRFTNFRCFHLLPRLPASKASLFGVPIQTHQPTTTMLSRPQGLPPQSLCQLN